MTASGQILLAVDRVVHLRLWHVGCRSCEKVLAPLAGDA
jgi:hypothetical protein